MTVGSPLSELSLRQLIGEPARQEIQKSWFSTSPPLLVSMLGAGLRQTKKL